METVKELKPHDFNQFDVLITVFCLGIVLNYQKMCSRL